MQKGFSVILILIGILVLGLVSGGAYYLGKSQNSQPKSQSQTVSQTPTPSPDETASWKTYASVKRKFTVNYPPAWLIDEVDPDGLYITSPNKAKDNQSFHMIIGVFETDKQLLEDYVKSTFTTDKLLQQKLMINGIQFYQLIDPNDKYPHLIAKIGNKIVDAQSEDGFPDGGAYYYDEKDSILMNNIKTFNQILSTFKFTQ